MNQGELKTQVASYLHRTDLDTEIDEFINRATERINRRFNLDNPDMTHPSNTNDVLTELPDLYLYAALAEGYSWTHNGAAATSYSEQFERQADMQNVTAPGTAADSFTDDPPPHIHLYGA